MFSVLENQLTTAAGSARFRPVEVLLSPCERPLPFASVQSVAMEKPVSGVPKTQTESAFAG